MGNYILETCVDCVESALAAEKGGASRIELCSDLVIGGVSPSLPLFRQIRKYTGLKVRVLLRPRYGDYCYNDYECDEIDEEIRMFREEGAENGGVQDGQNNFLVCIAEGQRRKEADGNTEEKDFRSGLCLSITVKNFGVDKKAVSCLKAPVQFGNRIAEHAVIQFALQQKAKLKFRMPVISDFPVEKIIQGILHADDRKAVFRIVNFFGSVFVDFHCLIVHSA